MNKDLAYSFVFRAILTKDALERVNPQAAPRSDEDVQFLLAVDALDERFIADARRVSVVYMTIAAFENSVRELISSTLLEEVGEDWWTICVSEKIKTQVSARMDDEEKIRWHTPRGSEPINFAMLPNLLNIMRQNHLHFSALVPDIEWAANVFEVVERSRNVIMHSGQINRRDMARLGTFIRDWSAQVYS